MNTQKVINFLHVINATYEHDVCLFIEYDVKPAKSIVSGIPAIIAFGDRNYLSKTHITDKYASTARANEYAITLKNLIDHLVQSNNNSHRYKNKTYYVHYYLSYSVHYGYGYKKNNHDIDNKRYIKDLYDIIVRPCIATPNNKKLMDETALQRTRDIIFYTHGDGSEPVYEFQNIMFSDMSKLGYNAPVISKIMKSLLVIQHNPTTPLENSRFNTISFISARNMAPHNQISEYIVKQNPNINVSYLEKDNLFISPDLTQNPDDEYKFVGLPEYENKFLTSNGQIIMRAERNAIKNGIDAMLSNQPLPSTEKLVGCISYENPDKINFQTIAKNGVNLINEIRQNLYNQNSVEHH